ncbi:EAL domain-containing protein [Massilia sp. W12]|uniref:EAL domain-containing protein n=1 Tax=Massilia sp. W12 TaxID=3126507 RepID=UPI0030D0F679
MQSNPAILLFDPDPAALQRDLPWLQYEGGIRMAADLAQIEAALSAAGPFLLALAHAACPWLPDAAAQLQQAAPHLPLLIVDGDAQLAAQLPAGLLFEFIDSRSASWQWRNRLCILQYLTQQSRLAAEVRMESEQTLAEARQRASRLRQVVSDAPIPMMLHAEDGAILMLSQTWVQSCGYDLQQTPDLPSWLALAMQAGQREALQQAMARSFADGDHSTEGEFQLKSADGRQLTWEFHLRPVHSLFEGSRLMITMALDISAHKEAERRLSAASHKNAMLLAASSDGIHILDLDGRVVQVNPAFCHLLGYAEDELVGRDACRWQMQWSALELRQLILSLPPHGRMLEALYLHKDGHALDVEINAIRLELEGQTLLYASARDISARKQMESTLRANEYLLRTALRIANLGTFEWNVVDNSEIWSEQLFRIFGLPPESGRPSHDAFFRILHADDVAKVGQALSNALAGVRPYDVEYRIVWPDGSVRHIHAQGEVHRNAAGQPVQMIGTTIDITERYLREEAQRLAITVFNTVDEGVLVCGPDMGIMAINPAFSAITGYSLHEIEGQNPRFLLDDGQDDEYENMMLALQHQQYWRGEFNQRRKNGELYVEALSVKQIRAENGQITHHVRVCSDITERKKSEQLIWRQANFDALTGLANRHMLQDRLQQEILKARRESCRLALLVIDLDRFKEVNDTLGHDMGDVLLVQAARRISACVRASDTVARLGGDEFVILLSQLDDIECVERIARDLIGSLAEPYLLNQEQAYISASIGIALYPDDAREIEDLLKHADQAMYSSKNAGRNRHCYFAAEMQHAAQARRRLTNDLRVAIEGGQFCVYYQPIIELNNGQIHKAEALVRWRHPVRGLVSPAEFIPLAEETGMINDIGDWVFRESAREVARLRDRFGIAFQISVNKSPVQFRKDGGPTRAWFRYLQELGLTGQSMVIEITEGLLMNVETNVTEKLLAFRDAGMQVSLDDFGTGYSSLSYLKKFDIDYLKIDKSFVANLENDDDNLTLCESIIVMAHKLGLKVVAEGVETRAQRDLLTRAGCDYAQGFFFAGPLDGAAFEDFLQRWDSASH